MIATIIFLVAWAASSVATSIPQYRYQNDKSLTTFEFPDSITSIGTSAFEDSGLSGPIDLSNLNITRIASGVFRNTKITQCLLPDTITEIKTFAFQNTHLTSFQFPDSVTSIEGYAFEGSGLNSTIDLSHLKITEIGYKCFANTKITQCLLPDTITTIQFFAFQNTHLTSFQFPDSVTYILEGAFQNSALSSPIDLSHLKITEISKGTFANTKITQCLLPPGVKSIGLEGFAGTSITSFEFPASLTNIGFNAFEDSSLSGSIDLSKLSITKIRDACFKNTKITQCKLPKTVTSIEAFAFENTQLTSFEFSTSIRSIKKNAFAGTPLSSIELSVSTSVQDYAFCGTGIRSAFIPKNTSITSTAFGDCLSPSLHNWTGCENTSIFLTGLRVCDCSFACPPASPPSFMVTSTAAHIKLHLLALVLGFCFVFV